MDNRSQWGCSGIFLCVALISGCASQDRLPSGPSESRAPSAKAAATMGDTIARFAQAQLGVPYHFGGASPEQGFDCSGLVFYTHQRVGLAVPRTSQSQYHRALKISRTQARPGDLVFFSDQKKLSHVGIYLGGGSFIHAPTTGRRVSEGHLSQPYYQQHLVGFGRLHSRD